MTASGLSISEMHSLNYSIDPNLMASRVTLGVDLIIAVTLSLMACSLGGLGAVRIYGYRGVDEGDCLCEGDEVATVSSSWVGSSDC